MNRTAEIELIKSLLERSENPAIISAVKRFIQKLQAKSEKHISNAQYNKEIDDALARMEAGEFVTHEEVIKQSRAWLSVK